MATSNQIDKATQSFTTAAECREDTNLLMQPSTNWEEYLTPAPMSIALLAELAFISSNTDFSICKGGPEGGFQYIKYPDSFRACLMQVCHSGWRAFNDAHKNMDQIRLYTTSVPNYIKAAVQILLQDDDNLVEAMLPVQLRKILKIADECVNLAQSTEKRFIDVTELINELLTTCIKAKRVYGKELEEVEKKIYENELRKTAAEEATKRAKEAFNNVSKQVDKAQESFKSAMDSIPSGWDIVGMNFVEGLSGNITTTLSGVMSMIATQVPPVTENSTSSTDVKVQPDAKNDQISENNIFSKAAEILPLVNGLVHFFDGDQIKTSEIIHHITKQPNTNWFKEQFVIIQKYLENEKECKPKNEALEICTKAITICSELGNVKPKEPDDAKTKQIVELMKSLRNNVMVFDTKSKSATNTSAFNITPPQISQIKGQSSGSKSAGQIATDNALFKVEQNRALLEKVVDLRENCLNNMEKNNEELTKILVTLRNCDVQKIDFNTTITMLSQGLGVMGNVKYQWQKLVLFFQMISNLIKTCLGTSLSSFVETSEEASNKTLNYSARMFLKDIIYSEAFYASNIASLVNMIAGTYTEISDKYLMDGVSRLSRIMTLDVNKPEFIKERELMSRSYEEAEEGIRNLVKKNKQEFERKTMQRLEKIESGLKAVLPPVSEEKKREIQEAVEKASKNDENVNQYI